MLVARERLQQTEIPAQNMNKKRRTTKAKTKVNPGAGYGIAVITFLLLAFWLAGRHVQLTSTSYELIVLRKQAQSLAVENQNLQNQIEQLNSLGNIESIATTKLGMQKPELTGGVQFVPVEYSKAGAQTSGAYVTTAVAKTNHKPKPNPIVQALASIING